MARRSGERLFALLDWEDNTSSVISMTSIKKPRIDVKNYQIGQAVEATFKGRLYQASIAGIHENKKHLEKMMYVPRTEIQANDIQENDPVEESPMSLTVPICNYCSTLEQHVQSLRNQLRDKAMEAEKFKTLYTQAEQARLAQSQAIGHSHARPKIGYVNQESVEEYKMEELFKGSNIYLYPGMIQEAKRKAQRLVGGQTVTDGKSFASCLLCKFYTTRQLARTSISDVPSPGQTALDKGVIEAIIGRALLETGSTRGAIRAALWSRITSANAWEKKQKKTSEE